MKFFITSMIVTWLAAMGLNIFISPFVVEPLLRVLIIFLVLSLLRFFEYQFFYDKYVGN